MHSMNTAILIKPKKIILKKLSLNIPGSCIKKMGFFI